MATSCGFESHHRHQNTGYPKRVPRILMLLMGEKPLQAASKGSRFYSVGAACCRTLFGGVQSPTTGTKKTGDTPKGYPLFFLMMMEGEETTSSCQQPSHLHSVGAACCRASARRGSESHHRHQKSRNTPWSVPAFLILLMGEKPLQTASRVSHFLSVGAA